MNNISTRAHRILCVEDDQELAKTLSEFLTAKIGASVHIVHSVADALTHIDRSAAFDFIVSDYQLPPDSGDGFYRALKDRGIKIPFVFYSGFDQIESITYPDSHFLGAVVKPELRKLANLIREVLSPLSK